MTRSLLNYYAELDLVKWPLERDAAFYIVMSKFDGKKMKRFHRNYCDAVFCHVVHCLSVSLSLSTLYIAFLTNRVEAKG